MRLGRAPIYAIFAVVHLAEKQSDGPTPGREIAEACRIPSAHLMKILQQLVRAGILMSGRGPSGGFALLRNSGDISILEVVEAVEGPYPSQFSIENSFKTTISAKEGIESCCKEVADFTRQLLKNTQIQTLID